MLSQVFNRQIYERIRLKNITHCLYFHPRTACCFPGGRKNTDVLWKDTCNANTKNMQIPYFLKVLLCFLHCCISLYLYIFADDLFNNKKNFQNSLDILKKRQIQLLEKKSYLSLIYLESREQMSGNRDFCAFHKKNNTCLSYLLV